MTAISCGLQSWERRAPCLPDTPIMANSPVQKLLMSSFQKNIAKQTERPCSLSDAPCKCSSRVDARAHTHRLSRYWIEMEPSAHFLPSIDLISCVSCSRPAASSDATHTANGERRHPSPFSGTGLCSRNMELLELHQDGHTDLPGAARSMTLLMRSLGSSVGKEANC